MAQMPRFTPMPANGFRGGPVLSFNGGMIPHNIPMPMMPPVIAPKSQQVSTVFVGNISDKADNDFVRQMLDMCGTVSAWKRMAGGTGKLQGFGFCDFTEPEGTLRALRVLNDFQLGDKKLKVKVELKHREMLKTYAEKEAGKPAKANSDELPASEDALKKDEEVRLNILAEIESVYPDLLKFEDGELSDKEKEKEKEAKQKDESKSRDVARRSKERSSTRRRRTRSRSPRSRSRSRSRGKGSARARSPRAKRHRRSSSSRSSSARSSSSRSSSSGSSYERSKKDHKKEKKRRSLTPSRARESEDSDDARERKELKKAVKEKEMAYTARLKEWESREKKMARKYEREERDEKQKKTEMIKEAKKLKAFLEDYDDERDDPKYYKSSSLFARRRDFEREKEADAKDRQKEQLELEELKKQILEEKKAEMKEKELEEEAKRRHEEQEAAVRAKMASRDGSGSPNPHQPLGQRRPGQGGDDDDGSSGSDSESGSEDEDKVKKLQEEDGAAGGVKKEEPVDEAMIQEATKWSSVKPEFTPSGVGSTGDSSPSATDSPSAAVRSPLRTSAPIRLNTLKQPAASVFGGDEEDEIDGKGRKKLKMFEITLEERIKTMSPGEIRKLQKEVADSIPAAKEKLFEHPIKYELFEKSGAMSRIKPWITKKIKEYIGEEDPTLISFICEKVQQGAMPDSIQADISMIIDNEAETFTVKLWRLLMYESECAARGIPVSLKP